MIYCHSTNNKINKTIKKLIMKRAILSVLLLFAFLTGFAQNRNICRLGITYDISQSDHWGKNKPVITSVIPYSPAELAGVTVCGDSDRLRSDEARGPRQEIKVRFLLRTL